MSSLFALYVISGYKGSHSLWSLSASRPRNSGHLLVFTDSEVKSGLDFCVSVQSPNSGSHLCVTGTFLTEPPPQLLLMLMKDPLSHGPI